MSDFAGLQISSQRRGATLTPEQKRFNTLVRQIEQARQTLAAWQKNVPPFQQTFAQAVLPLQSALIAARKEWALGLDALLDQRGWTRTERATLRDLICDAAGDLLEIDEEDAELKALFDKYSEIDFDTGKQQDLQMMKELTEVFTGLDLGDSASIRTDEDLFQRMSERMEEVDAAREARRASSTKRRRKSGAEQRHETEAQLATHSVRDIYRKLASALHPDRESDPARRQEKTDLMQKINRAYEANDLLTLLETHSQLEPVNSSAIFGADTQRLKRYNKVLTSQLNGLKSDIANVESAFRYEYAVEPMSPVNPHKLSGLIDARVRLLRTELARQRQDTRRLGDRSAMKHWLKKERQAMQEDWFDDDFF